MEDGPGEEQLKAGAGRCGKRFGVGSKKLKVHGSKFQVIGADGIRPLKT
jgi:hypothetical protein